MTEPDAGWREVTGLTHDCPRGAALSRNAARVRGISRVVGSSAIAPRRSNMPIFVVARQIATIENETANSVGRCTGPLQF